MSVVDIIEPGLMEEPCDFGICTEAATPSSSSQRSSRPEKKRHAKSVTDQTPEHGNQRKPEKTYPAPTQVSHSKEYPERVTPARPRSPPQVAPTRKELQDALPKIPPLSSFKSCSSRFVSFEEAEQDFHSFITTGLGRSVDVIREFRGREEGDPDENSGHRDCFTLYDDGAESLKQHGKRWKTDLSHTRSTSGSSSSKSIKDEREIRAVAKPQTEATQTPTLPRQKADPTKSQTCAPQIYPQTVCASNGRASPQQENYESFIKSSKKSSRTAPARTDRPESRVIKEEIGKRSKRISENTDRERTWRERDEGEHDDVDDDDEEEEEEEEEGEWSAESYWRASYRAWSDYASMCSYPEQGYQNHYYYSVAQNWMAAYRMNAVYMEELLKH